MSSVKIHTIILGLMLIQCVWAKPFNDTDNFADSPEEETPKTIKTTQKLFLHACYNFLLLSKHLAVNAVNVSRYILKDQDVVANTKPEVEEFKTNLNGLLEIYETTDNPFWMWIIIDIYSATTDHYLKLDQEKVTPESAFIIGILNKYNAKDVVNVKFGTEFLTFIDSFGKFLKERKGHFMKPILDGNKKYSDTDRKDLVIGVMELIKA